MEMVDYERMIEEHAFKRKLVEQHLEQESSGKNSNTQKLRVATIRKCVSSLRWWMLGVGCAWGVGCTSFTCLETFL